MSEKVWIFDTTLRDGEQSPGCSMNLDEKLRMAHQLERLGVDIIEAGFPIASPGDFESVRRIAAEVRGPMIAGLARAHELDINRAWEALKDAARPRIHTFLATSDIHLKYKLRKTREEILKMISTMVAHAKSLCRNVEFSPEDAGRSDRSYLIECCHAAVEAGADVLNLPDTVGFCMPEEYGQMFADVKAKVPGMDRVILSSHTHDDLGLGVANALAALKAGARQVECTVNGIGERAGNSSLEEVAMSLYVRKDLHGLHTDIRHKEIYPASRLLVEITGVHVQRNKAIVGQNAFAHEAGIHQDGVLKKAITYEIMDPQTVGMPANSIVLGKHSGRHALSSRYEELGYSLTKPEIERAYSLFCQLADRKKQVYDEDLINIVNKGFDALPGGYTLKSLECVTRRKGPSEATVELEKDGQASTGSAKADGPCDAVFRAVDSITGLKGTIEDLSVHTVGSSQGGVAEVDLVCHFGVRQLMGKASGANLVEAAAQAYLQASNKAVFESQRVWESKTAGGDPAARNAKSASQGKALAGQVTK